jgi:hypothetical protein
MSSREAAVAWRPPLTAVVVPRSVVKFGWDSFKFVIFAEIEIAAVSIPQNATVDGEDVRTGNSVPFAVEV